VRRLVLVVFFFEVGVVLIFIPWSAFWDRNYFAQALPSVQTLITNNFFRGAVSGLGVLNVVAGFVELVSVVFRTASDPPTTIRAETREGLETSRSEK
jgi:hypothetical protein